MIEQPLSLFNNAARSDWIRLRTLISLRWLAITGQTIAILVASLILELNIRLDLVALAIGLSIAFNLFSLWFHPKNTRLTEREAMLTLLFDIGQLALLLYLAGGLSNPFVLLFLAPVTISATALTLRSTLLLAVVTIVAITALMFWHLPLEKSDGTMLEIAPLFVQGMWMALVIGIVFLAGYARRVTVEGFSMSLALQATQMALAREQKLTALGGVVAAAAHELGTPLATIKLVSTELAEEVRDDPVLLDDINLINEQAERCRIILHDMGRAGKDDALLRNAPLVAVLEEAAEPHVNRGIRVDIRQRDYASDEDRAPGEHPLIARHPEVIHGLRNLIQNAVDFAASRVVVEYDWSDTEISLAIADDGPGIPIDLLGRIGDPFLRRPGSRKRSDPQRPGYDGMGLGVFIAKTLLERSGAGIVFSNRGQSVSDELIQTLSPLGAVVEVSWQREALEIPVSEARAALGENRHFDT